MAKFWSVLVLPAFVCLAPAPAAGQEDDPLVTDRPDFTESAAVPGHGRVQVEGGWTVEESGDAREHSLGEILVRIGLGKRFEARIEPGSWVAAEDGEAEVSGLDDAGLGVKILLLEEVPPARPALALLLSSSVPTGDDEIGSTEWHPEARLALGWTLSDVWSLGANAGWARAADESESFDLALGSVAVGRSLGERLGMFLELYGFAPSAPGEDDALVFDGGLTLGFGPDAQLDVRAGAGLTDVAPDWLFGLGFARRW
ncbi:MAG TPA: transporter [Gemmatimonadota bacterium]|nr:transporter [Gemmatimonadota bacterium]